MTGSQQPKTNKSPDILKGSYQKALNSALRILTGRDHSEYELTRKLKKRGFKAEDIEKAVSECKRLDYINDERTAKAYIRQLIRKGYGVKRIRHDMSQKGFRGEQIQYILAEIVSDAEELDNALKIYRKNARRFEREKDQLKRRDKIYRFFYARGFSPETIRKIIDNYL